MSGKLGLMTQFQLEKQQIRNLLGIQRVPSGITLYDLATMVIRAIQLETSTTTNYTQLLAACIVVIRYHEVANEQRRKFLSTFQGRKALAILAQVTRQKRDLETVAKIFDYKF